MERKPNPIPEGFHTVTPHLVIKGAAKAIDFYQKAFGATVRGRMMSPDGVSVLHAALQIGDSIIMLNDEFPEMGAKSPTTLNGSPVVLHLYVEDADNIYEQAIRAGTQSIMPLENTFWGDRYGVIVDPFGHRWAIATHIEDVSIEEAGKRMATTAGAAH